MAKIKSYTYRIDRFEWIKLYYYVNYIEFRLLRRRFRAGWFEHIMNQPFNRLVYIRNWKHLFHVRVGCFAFGWMKDNPT